jgi:predicted nucleotidyltransferase component of viral defense system
MAEVLHYSTLNPLLLHMLNKLMAAPEFSLFRLVGGTALSLQLGHRKSVDIDLFTDARYGSVNFAAIDKFLRETYAHVSTNEYAGTGFGKAYYVGDNPEDSIKLDVFYTDPFILPAVSTDGIRMAAPEDIIAMKLDVISRGGRKKDFWDIHELIEKYPVEKMFALHKQRYPDTHQPKLLKKMFTDFSLADTDFDPDCLKGKYWEVIKLDMIDFATK